MGTKMKLGVLSDTHGLLRQEVLDHLQGCDAILHGGDINNQGILHTLGSIATVYVVRGNNDKEWAESLPLFLDFELAGKRVYMTHKKRDLPAELDGYDLVVFGHTHRYEIQHVGNTVLLNPGCCGPRRFNQPITMAMVSISESGRIEVQRIDIEHQGPRAKIGADLRGMVETVIGETRRPAVDAAERRK